jgi:hypothetical protein
MLVYASAPAAERQARAKKEAFCSTAKNNEVVDRPDEQNRGLLRIFNGGCKDQHARLFLRESHHARDSGSNVWGWNCRPPAPSSDYLNSVSNQTLSQPDSSGAIPLC